MDTSILLACLIGPLFVAVGIGVLLNPAHYTTMAENFLKDAGLYYVSGAMVFVIGMAMVLYHNIWVADWRVIITILGWMSLLKGTVRIVYPSAGSQIAANLIGSETTLKASAAVILLLGAWLTYQGFAG